MEVGIGGFVGVKSEICMTIPLRVMVSASEGRPGAKFGVR